MKKKAKEFRPCKISRYLVGTANKDVLRSDLKEYNGHRYKLFTAKAKVDCSPPKMNPFGYVNQRKLSTDASRLRQIDKDNKQLLKQINLVNTTIGRLDTYNPHAYAQQSKWKRHEQMMKKIEEKNKTIYQNLISAKSSYNRKSLKEFWDGIMKKIQLSAKLPVVILNRVSRDTVLAKQPSISTGLDKIADRPLCFMDFKVHDGEFLGRIVIELYHDHVPVTVQNFLALCSGENEKNLTYKNCLIYRIVRGRFLETGDITRNTGRGGCSIYGKTFEEEGHKLKHTKGGVLSMVRIKKHSNNSRFCITFENMEQLDKQNVVFGKVIKGADNLTKIEGYGRRVGKPLAPIIISNCGKL